MNQPTKRRVPFGQPIFPEKRLSEAELAKRKAEDEAFAQRCRAIFRRVSPELIKEHYDWAIMIEPDSGDYFIDPDPEVAFQKAKQKHPTGRFLEKRLNETGCVGRI